MILGPEGEHLLILTIAPIVERAQATLSPCGTYLSTVQMDSSQLSSGPMQFRIHGVRTGQMVAKRAGELPDDSLTKGPSVTWAPAGQACTLSARSFRGREVIKLHRGASRSTTCAWLNQRATVRSAELAFSPSG